MILCNDVEGKQQLRFKKRYCGTRAEDNRASYVWIRAGIGGCRSRVFL